MGVCCTSSGKTPSDWIASTKKKTPRSRQSSPRASRSLRKPLANSTAETVSTRVRPSIAARMSSMRERGCRGSARPRTSTPRSREVHPRVLVRGVFLGGKDDVVAGPPREALGDDADAMRGVRDEVDVVRARGIDEPGGEAADVRDAVEPGLDRRDAVLGEVVGVFAAGPRPPARRAARRRRGPGTPSVAVTGNWERNAERSMRS